MRNTVELKNRKDVELLVHQFYKLVREDDLLGPIFNNQIHDWPAHLTHLTNFWDSSLFHSGSYKGNPIEKHLSIDYKENHRITQVHFGRWLQLWFATIDSLFHGDNAHLAKNRARNMSTFIFIKIFEARKLTN